MFPPLTLTLCCVSTRGLKRLHVFPLLYNTNAAALVAADWELLQPV